MKIYDSQDQLLLDVEVDDSSVRYRAIKGEHSLTLKYSLAEHIELPRGAWCEYEGERYELLSPEAVKMQHTRHYDYTLTLEAQQARLKLWKLRNLIDGRLKFPLTATPREHLQLLVNVLNERSGGGWTIGDCITEPERLISYDHNSCWEALAKLAEEFKTEWEITGKRISLRKVEHNKKQPLRLGYGKGRGLRSGLGRKAGEALPTEILWVQGGDRNVDRSRYGSATLHLPTSATIAYDGEYFEDERGFDRLRAKRYKTDDRGLSLRRADKPLTTATEASINAPDIYPSRVGSVTSVREVNATQHFWDFCDSTIPESLDYDRCLIAGQTMTVIFQSGQLAGREFEVKYRHQGAAHSGKAARCFELIPQEVDGMTMPSATFAPRVGDKYAVFHVMLPEAYINDRATRSGAEWELLRRCVRHLWEHEEQKYSYTAELDGLWAKKDWLNIGGRIILGGYIELHDERLAPEGVLLRIVGIKDSVNDPHSPIVELSNELVSAGLSGSILKLKDDEALVEEYHRSALQFTRRRFRDAAATAEALQSALLEKFTKSISPITLQTMQLLVGDESLQWRFVRAPRSNETFTPRIAWEPDRLIFTIEGATIQHQTLGITSLSSSHRPEEHRYWTMPSFSSPALTERGERYYVYARVEREGKVGSYRLEREARALESESGYYWLLVGLLEAAAADGSRSFARLYGFTEILPGQMRTERIASPDGDFVIDLINKQIITPSLRFSSSGKSVEQIIREGDKTALEGAKNYAEGKAREAKGYADEKAEEAKRWNVHTHTFDLTQLDPNKYYAAIIHLPSVGVIGYEKPARFDIALFAGLDRSVPVPPYATHSMGFHVELRWSVSSSSWGVRQENRIVTGYTTKFVRQGEEVMSTPAQRTEVSAEYVYLRGGGRYIAEVKSDYKPTFALATENWSAAGDGRHPIYSPVDRVTPPKTDVERLRDDMREGDKATLEGAKNAAKNYFDSGKAEILRGLDATTRGLVERITGADNRLTDAERKLGETQQQLAQSKEQLAGQLTASIAQLEARNAELQRQVDKQVQSFFGVNPPTGRIDWTEADDAKHEGDTYTCVPPDGVTITSANAAQYPNVGKSWRFTRGGWVQIADTDTTRALALAGQAKAAADGKVTHYRGSSAPTGYKEGDLWTLTADWTSYKKGAILTAVRDYVAGQYNPSHWREEVRYTDDSAVRDLQLGGRNYAKGTAGVKDGSGYNVAEFRVGAPWVAGVDYTVSFVLGSEHPDMVAYLYVDGWSVSDTAVRPEGTPTQGADGLYYARYSATFRTTESRIDLSVKRIAGGNGGFRLYKTRRVGGSDQGRYSLSRVMLERGNKPSDWSLAPEDVDDNIESKAKEAKDHADANLAKANRHTDTSVSALERKQVTTAEELQRLSEAQAADREQLSTTSDTAAKAKELAEAAKNGLGSLDYLARAIKDGETTVSGGVVLANILAAKELGTGAVRSFIAGEIYNERTKRLYPAFAAGVTGFGTAQERRVVEINHDGTGHFGSMAVEQGGQIIRFYPQLGAGGQVLRIGGYQPSLDEIISSRPYSATLSHSGGFARRDVLRENIDDLWRSQSFDAPAGAIISYRFSVRDLKCFFQRRAGDPALAGQDVWTPEPKWAGSLYLRISIYKEGDTSQVPVAREVQVVGANGVILDRKQDANFSSISFLAPSSGRYYALLDVDRGNYGEVGSTHYGAPPEDLRWLVELDVNPATGSVSKTASTLQETVISDKGITILKSAKRFVVISPYESDDKPVLSVRGKIDIPGVLLAAQVKINGGRVERVVSKWGTLADALRIEHIGVGRWRITHNLGHADYSVHASAHSNGYGGIYVQEQRTHSFEVVTSDRSDPADGLSFSVLVIGDPK